MVSRNKIVTTVMILLLLSILFSGCAREKKIISTPDSGQKEAVNDSSQNVIPSSEEENIPQIRIVSFASIYLHDNLGGQYLFGWENVPGNESHRLLSFLKDDFDINWVENAQITKTEENKTIRVFSAEKSIEIMLNNESAALNISEDYRSYYLLVKEENSTHNVYNFQNKYDISERYYASYNLSIRNNGLDPLYFKPDGLRLHDGNQTFNTTHLPVYGSSLVEVLSDLEKENKLHDTTLLPGQTLNGTVVFRVNSLYNRSFLLMYNTTPVTSASFEKSIDALRAAEHFDYSVALGVPPYSNISDRSGMSGSFEPDFSDCCSVWANWVNRSIFETFQKSDVEQMRKSPPDEIPFTAMVYALRVIPERNIIMSPVTTREFSSNLLVIADTDEEIINISVAGVAVLSNQTYTLFKPQWKLIMPQMNYSNVSVVQISFEGYFGWPMASRNSFSNQDVILDKDLNIIVVRYYPLQFLS